MSRFTLPLASSFGVACAALVLAACTQTASAPPAPPPGAVPGVTPNTFRMPEGAGCAGEIGQFKAVLKNDVDTGNVGQSVYNRATADLGRAESACAAGRDGDARALLASTKSRFGYR
ncbi:hypothetical protein [Enterovirga sp. CN4-39]|uniref:hypothetical protein n=1 Tax=Enterovirga sp. CN4-39 TaxID=3400910 RepID=UPI003C097BB0